MEQRLYPGPALEHLVVLPDAYDAGRTYPLVLCLHGYGANMEDLAGLAPVLDPAGYVYVFPNGPLPAFDGADPTTRTWYERGGNESPEAVAAALGALDNCVQAVLSHYRVPASQALLVGFSQGGAMALRYGLPRPDVFAGIAVLSGSLRRLEDLVPDLPTARKQSIFVGHGTKDSLVPVEYSRRLVAFLQDQRYRPFFRTYPVDHQISPVEMRDLREWTQKTLPGKSNGS
jgi:phospholipase/carboxylesterase